MATPNVAGQSNLDNIKKQIIEVFERIITEVKARRDELLAQVDEMSTKFELKNASVMESIRELEEMRAQTEKMSVKQNLAVKKQQESLADICSEIEKLNADLNNNSNVKFNCSIYQLNEQIKQFGEVVDESNQIAKKQSIYLNKLTAVQIITHPQEPEFGSSCKLHIDHELQRLYVRSILYCKVYISVFNGNDFTFIQSFGGRDSYYNCIATSKEFIYVACSCVIQYELAQYKQSDFSLVRRFGYSKNALSNIFVNSDNEVLLLCFSKDNYYFLVYDRALNFKNIVNICQDYPLLIGSRNPFVYPSQLREKRLFILNKHTVVVQTEGEKGVHSILGSGGKSKILKNPTSFCIDEVGNIIITDSATNSIKFFSPEGDLFHKIGEDTVGSDVIEGLYDVVTFSDKVIVSYKDGPIRVY